jgi:hypothetical protein
LDFKKNVILLILIYASGLLFAQENEPIEQYYFIMQEDGNPQFKQILSWKEISGALAYELIVKNDRDVEIYRIRTSVPAHEIDLTPGSYHYSIIVYNLLDKPEIQSEWIPIEIIKAEMPLISEMKPENIYIEEYKFKVTLKGDKLLEDSEYWLINSKSDKILIRLENAVLLNEGIVQIQVPDSVINPGQYSIRVVNPGGLSCVSPRDFKISFLKPFDLGFSLGYAPFVPLYDSWVTSNWDNNFYPLGALARVKLIFIKKNSHYLGIEMEGTVLSFDDGIDEATIESTYYSGGINLLYKYLISKKIHLAFRLGGGFADSIYSFDYEGTSGSSINSLDPYLTSGLSMQYFINRSLFIEGGADWRHIFYNTYNLGGIYPYLSMGLCF